MSGHGLPSRGDPPAATQERKVDNTSIRLQPVKVQQQPAHRGDILPTHIPQRDLQQYKQEIGIKSSLPGRPIAPAPAAATTAAAVTGLVSQLPTTAKVLSLSTPHPGQKYTHQVMGNTNTLDGAQAPQTSAPLPAHIPQANPQSGVMTLTSQAVVNSPLVSQAPQVAGVPTIQTLSVTGGHTSGGGILTAHPVAPVNIPMASLIRGSTTPTPVGGLNPQVSAQTTQASLGQATLQAASMTQSSVVHAFQSHVPRGAAAASALTATPKGSPVATAVLRQTQPGSVAGTVQIPTATTVATQPTIIPNLGTLPAQLNRTQLLAAPGARPGSPAITATTNSGAHSQPDMPRGLLLSSTPGAVSSLGVAAAATVPTSREPVQITIPQPQRTVVDVSARPMASPMSTRPVTIGQQPSPLVQQQQQPQQQQPGVHPQVLHGTQKVMMSSQAGIAPLLQPTPSTSTTVVSVTTPKVSTQSPVFNLSQPVQRPQKPPAAASQSGAASAQVSIANLGQGQIRPQKLLLSGHHQTTVTTAAKQGSGTALNLSQGARNQKVVMPHTTMATASISGSVPKSAKVPPQRQLPQTGSGGSSSSEHFHRQQQEASGPTPLQPRPPPQPQQLPPQQSQPSLPATAQVALTQASTQQPGGTAATATFLSPGVTGAVHRPSTAVASTSASTLPVSTAPDAVRAPTVVTTDSRGGFPQQLPFSNLPQEYSAYYYQNLVYQQIANQALAGSAIRPVPSQTPNLAATLQAAAPSGAVTVSTTVSSSQATVGAGGGATTGSAAVAAAAAGATGNMRLNPMGVVMDPARPPSLIQSQFAATAGEGSRLAQDVSSAAPSGTSTHTISIGSQPTVAMTTHVALSNTLQPVATTISQPSSSPARPSILRKRPNEGVPMVKKTPLGGGGGTQGLMARDTCSPAIESSGLLSGLPASPKPSLLDPSRENSQSSTDTASSAESTPNIGLGHSSDVKVKDEPMDTLENGPTLTGGMLNSTDASPRKKPRKQLLHANEEFQDEEETSSDNDDEGTSVAKMNLQQALEKVAEDIKKEDLEEYVDEEGVRWIRERKRPPVVNLLNYYQCTWKTRFNHFQRYTDVKSKEERRPTVNELSNQKSVQQKASGWKMYHLAAQLEDLVDMEREVCSRLSDMREEVAPRLQVVQNPSMEDDITMVHELTQGNMQRCKLLVDQLMEARACMIKVLDHRPRIGEIIARHHSKRPVKKKERT